MIWSLINQCPTLIAISEINSYLHLWPLDATVTGSGVRNDNFIQELLCQVLDSPILYVFLLFLKNFKYNVHVFHKVNYYTILRTHLKQNINEIWVTQQPLFLNRLYSEIVGIEITAELPFFFFYLFAITDQKKLKYRNNQFEHFFFLKFPKKCMIIFDIFNKLNLRLESDCWFWAQIYKSVTRQQNTWSVRRKHRVLTQSELKRDVYSKILYTIPFFLFLLRMSQSHVIINLTCSRFFTEGGIFNKQCWFLTYRTLDIEPNAETKQ